ncbi:MAG: lamin tail domain-containing protein [Chitinophagaceae bacterium]
MKKKLTVVLLAWQLCSQAQTARPYNVVIDEIMADPSPVVGLPNAEFIELRNVSLQPFNLNGWRIGDASGFATFNINFILQPDSFVIICASSTAAELNVFGSVIAVSNFPSLDNDGDQLYLRSKEGSIIHAVQYTADWYRNPIKNQGGWTIEMIDPQNPCSGLSNWNSSAALKGGTPGKKNSMDGINTDQQPPMLLHAFAADSINSILTFDEPLDSAKAAVASNYRISDGVGLPLSATPLPPFYNQVKLRSATWLGMNKVYTVSASGLTDCAGNSIGAYHIVKLGRAAVADSFDVVINEILFNPKPDAADYVELFNRSNKIIDVKDFYIANRAANAMIGSVKQISADNRLLFPGEYALLTENVMAVKTQYLAKVPEAFVAVSSMPSFPDDKGTVVMLNAQGKIVDELNYDAHWHFKLLDNDEGIALERIDYNKPTQEAANWHSAATSAGYGTPGYQNSQFKTDLALQGSITLTPPVFSPDNDGFDDFLTISYQFTEPGYVCNITVYDAVGRPVRYLTRNGLCGLQGYFRWDGLDEKNTKLPIGVYVVVTDIFNLQGKTKRFKQAITLARRL